MARDIEALSRTNVFWLLAVTRAVLPSMRRRRSGHIINFSSGTPGRAGLGVYCSSKLAAEGLSDALAVELQPLGIHVTLVEPGYFGAALIDTKSVSARTIADYRDTSGALRMGFDDSNPARPSDPAKLADALIKLIDEPNPPYACTFDASLERGNDLNPRRSLRSIDEVTQCRINRFALERASKRTNA
jgi:NAD(P)-dependent dehydrogenase (short-subunit alcohol dehydrogenase family)